MALDGPTCSARACCSSCLIRSITGVALALYYTPTAETAHTSVAYITKQVAGGAFLRSLHSYGSSAMIIVLALHFLQTFLYGSFKGRRELLWMSGALLSFLILGMGFTGYLLPWDQKAYFATTVGTNIAGQVPLIGNLMARILRGGDTIGTLTLSRFYVAHVFLIPATILLFVGAHIFLFRKAGPAGPVSEDPVSPKLPREPFYPRQVLFDMGFVLLIIAVLSGLSYLRPVTLGPIANPADSHFLPRPEWYYLPMFEWLKFWEGPAVVVGVVVIPGLVAAALFLMPFHRSPTRTQDLAETDSGACGSHRGIRNGLPRRQEARWMTARFRLRSNSLINEKRRRRTAQRRSNPIRMHPSRVHPEQQSLRSADPLGSTRERESSMSAGAMLVMVTMGQARRWRRAWSG